MLRKWTLKIFLRCPKWRMTSKISRPGQPASRDGALAEVQAVVRALLHGHELLQAVDGAQHRIDPAEAGGTDGSCGWQAIRTLFSAATGTTRSRK
jgi:hypothetical protein